MSARAADAQRLVTAKELAEVLSLSPATVLDKWERGDLPGYKIGRAVRFDVGEVLASCRRDAKPNARGTDRPLELLRRES